MTEAKCKDCDKTFKNERSLYSHQKLMHSGERSKSICADCGKSFTSKELSKHYKRVHLKEKPYQCAFCPKSFFAKKMLEDHTNGVHLNLKPYQCEMCEFATAYSARIREHQKVAHGNQKFDCPHCPHTARYKNNLDKHINNVHKNLFMIDQ